MTHNPTNNDRSLMTSKAATFAQEYLDALQALIETREALFAASNAETAAEKVVGKLRYEFKTRYFGDHLMEQDPLGGLSRDDLEIVLKAVRSGIIRL